jgi:hypothetical protein
MNLKMASEEPNRSKNLTQDAAFGAVGRSPGQDGHDLGIAIDAADAEQAREHVDLDFIDPVDDAA